MNKTSVLIYILIVLILYSCSAPSNLVKMNEEEIFYLAKVGTLNNKVSKILNPKGKEISREEVSKFSVTDFYNDRFKDLLTDSIVLKIRKLKKSDLLLRQKIGFYSYYGKYADTITAKMNIECSKTDSLLLIIYDKDQESRSDDRELNSMIDSQNQRILFNIIEQCGFPNSITNKKESVFYAFIVLLHSDISFKKKYLFHIKTSVKKGDLDKRYLAYFEDKINIEDEKKQKYGTQMKIDRDGNEVLAPVDDIMKVNKRRKKIGLEPLNLK